MPLVRIVSSAPRPNEDSVRQLLGNLSRLLSREFDKPEQWVMTCLEAPAAMSFGGTFDPACYVEVKNIGTMSPELARRVTAEVSRELAEHLGVPTRRIYVELADAEAHLWGFDGDTFG
ncbi:MAG: phenylpyruvate tautomerase MIF-related protein [Polyangiaceae bacterium]